MRWRNKRQMHLSRHLSSRCDERGDTLVEVAIAMAIMGLMLAATMMIINRSLLGVMNAVERTASRGEVNSQVEMLRYVFDTQGGVNKEVANDIIDSTPVGDTSQLAGDEHGCSIGGHGFYLELGDSADQPIRRQGYASTTNVAEDVFAAPHPGNGIWIEGVKTEAEEAVPGYIDFYVRACWSPYASNEIGQGRLESIVRVYYKEES